MTDLETYQKQRIDALEEELQTETLNHLATKDELFLQKRYLTDALLSIQMQVEGNASREKVLQTIEQFKF